MKQIFGIDIPRTLEDVCQPRHLALLVYDMQAGIKSQVKNADLIVERVARTLEAARGGVHYFYPAMSLPKEVTKTQPNDPRTAWLSLVIH